MRAAPLGKEQGRLCHPCPVLDHHQLAAANPSLERRVRLVRLVREQRLGCHRGDPREPMVLYQIAEQAQRVQRRVEAVRVVHMATVIVRKARHELLRDGVVVPKGSAAPTLVHRCIRARVPRRRLGEAEADATPSTR